MTTAQPQPSISNADYHADPAVSASHLKAISISPLHYWARYVDPDRITPEPTPAMRLGSMVHCTVLEPHELPHRYLRVPDGIDRRTKDGKAAWAELEASGKELIKAADWDMAMAMAEACWRHPAAGKLLRQPDGLAELSFWWSDGDLRCKCRPDLLAGDVIVDLKTTTDASPAAFARAVVGFGYHLQAAHYLAGTGAARFVFLAVEKAPPYAVAVYELDAAALATGEQLRQEAMHVIRQCRQADHWPGYSDDCQTLSLPKWAVPTDLITPDQF